jgi:hypothetical protein
MIYPSTYILFLHPSSPLPLARLLIAIVPASILDIAGSYIDGITRGSTVAILTSSLVSLPAPGAATVGPVGAAILSGICISGGGWIVQTLGLNLEEWKLGTPVVLRNGAGILDTLDTWSAVICSIIYSILIFPNSAQAHTQGDYEASCVVSPSFDNFVRSVVPTRIGTNKLDIQAITTNARAVVVLLMGSILAARVITRLVLSRRAPLAGKVDAQIGIEMEELDNVPRSRAETPKKKKGASTPKKSPGPGAR